MGKLWIEVTTRGSVKRAEEAAAILVECGSPGIIEEKGKRKGEIELRAYLPKKFSKHMPALRKRFKKLRWTLSTRIHEEKEWTEKWKHGLKPTIVQARGIRKRVVIQTTWEETKPRASDATVLIDPGMAFGTGAHPTTKLCIKALLEISNKKKNRFDKILDIGTGSGILSIAALKLGAKKTFSTDTCPEAVRVARKNASLNKVRSRMTIGSREPEDIPGRYDVVVANILSCVVIDYMEALVARMEEGAYLILSGLLYEEKAEVDEAARAEGLKRVTRYHGVHWGDKWAALVFKKP